MLELTKVSISYLTEVIVKGECRPTREPVIFDKCNPVKSDRGGGPEPPEPCLPNASLCDPIIECYPRDPICLPF